MGEAPHSPPCWEPGSLGPQRPRFALPLPPPGPQHCVSLTLAPSCPGPPWAAGSLAGAGGSWSTPTSQVGQGASSPARPGHTYGVILYSCVLLSNSDPPQAQGHTPTTGMAGAASVSPPPVSTTLFSFTWALASPSLLSETPRVVTQPHPATTLPRGVRPSGPRGPGAPRARGSRESFRVGSWSSFPSPSWARWGGRVC